ncbi:RimK family alpha-L-glutamate ligase [Pedobacter sp. SYP-B3415]|uniref:ATP-grasp domain-containing protein n=1 Tax=Pedobacter sp. SYP-B3415 TaxID=2496641 RepID=UPI00101D321D|nr:hypothetical protein [Pedobacter sp. SYP-B3415]
MKIALITYQPPEGASYEILFSEEEHLASVIRDRGYDVVRTAWDDAAVNWGQFDLGIIRSPWDYFERYAEFMNWLDRLQKTGLRLMNDYEVLRWNSDKHYLNDISQAGFAVIPSVFIEQGTVPDIDKIFEELGRDKLIVKPCVSGGARNTRILTREQAGEAKTQLSSWLSSESYMVQPFVEEINAGEWSFIFFNGKFSHSLLKVPRRGDFRVQHVHGGSILCPDTDPAHIKEASSLVKHFAADCLYARVDAVVVQDRLQLMELELIEPYLFLDTAPGSAEAFADALQALLGTKA